MLRVALLLFLCLMLLAVPAIAGAAASVNPVAGVSRDGADLSPVAMDTSGRQVMFSMVHLSYETYENGASSAPDPISKEAFCPLLCFVADSLDASLLIESPHAANSTIFSPAAVANVNVTQGRQKHLPSLLRPG